MKKEDKKGSKVVLEKKKTIKEKSDKKKVSVKSKVGDITLDNNIFNNKFVIIGGIFLIIIVIIIFIFFGKGEDLKYGSGNSSKERKFVVDLGKKIEEYLDIYGPNFTILEDEYSFCKDKCDSKDKHMVTVHQIGIHKDEKGLDDYEIKVGNLVASGLIVEDKFINPATGKKCYEYMRDYTKIVDPIITVYRDSDDDYYYYIDLSGNTTICNISKKNGFISNMPSELIKVLEKKKVKLPEELIK